MKGLAKGIIIGAGVIAGAVGGIIGYRKAKKEDEAEAEAKEPMEINPEYAETFLEEDEPTVEVEEPKKG